jgi:hypothetical protein
MSLLKSRFVFVIQQMFNIGDGYKIVLIVGLYWLHIVSEN